MTIIGSRVGESWKACIRVRFVLRTLGLDEAVAEEGAPVLEGDGRDHAVAVCRCFEGYIGGGGWTALGMTERLQCG